MRTVSSMENSEPLAYEDSTYASENIIASGYCGGDRDGTNLSWEMTDDGTLTISGNGKMKDFENPMASWYVYAKDILSVKFDGNVTSIGDYAFSTCTSLTSIEIPNSVTSIGDYAFNSCISLTSVEIPNGVTSIGNRAFIYCHSLTSIKIPSSVTYIGSYAFSSCGRLSEILVDSANPEYCSIDGVMFSKDRTELICYPAGKQGASYEIPSSVTAIDAGAFEYCPMLSQILVDSSNPSYCSVDGVLFSKDRTELIRYPGGVIKGLHTKYQAALQELVRVRFLTAID